MVVELPTVWLARMLASEKGHTGKVAGTHHAVPLRQLAVLSTTFWR